MVGLTAEGTSRRACTIHNSRGTVGYPAPELLGYDFSKNTFTNKVDIFAIGCIFHELVTGQKAFVDDWRIYQTYSSPNPEAALERHLPIISTSNITSQLIVEMLNINPQKRPKAIALHTKFNTVANWTLSPLPALQSLEPSTPLRMVEILWLRESIGGRVSLLERLGSRSLGSIGHTGTAATWFTKVMFL